MIVANFVSCNRPQQCQEKLPRKKEYKGAERKRGTTKKDRNEKECNFVNERKAKALLTFVTDSMTTDMDVILNFTINLRFSEFTVIKFE